MFLLFLFALYFLFLWLVCIQEFCDKFSRPETYKEIKLNRSLTGSINAKSRIINRGII